MSWRGVIWIWQFKHQGNTIYGKVNSMNNNKTNDGFLSFAVVIGALLLFAKTADVMSYFSPTILNDIIGQDVSLLYGIITAAMVEGMILALHFNQRATLSAPAQWVKWILIIISGVCQFFDGTIVTNTLAQQSDTLKMVFSFGVPLIPLLIVIMIIWIGQLPDSPKQRKPWKGFKHTVNQLPKIWYGENYIPSQHSQHAPVVTPNASETELMQLNEVKTKANPPLGANGKH
jgi:hypothetical protein